MISFRTPETYDQIEAVGALVKASFELARAYGIEEPAKLINDITSSAEWKIESLLDKQKIDTDAEDQDGTTEKAKADAPNPEEDQPINLDDIPF